MFKTLCRVLFKSKANKATLVIEQNKKADVDIIDRDDHRVIISQKGLVLTGLDLQVLQSAGKESNFQMVFHNEPSVVYEAQCIGFTANSYDYGEASFIVRRIA